MKAVVKYVVPVTEEIYKAQAKRLGKSYPLSFAEFYSACKGDYEDAWNGNRSAIHWDLVLIQRPEYGGGEIYFDDKLIRKDGIFVIDSLKCLNPNNLK